MHKDEYPVTQSRPLAKAAAWQKKSGEALPKDYTGDEKMILRLRQEGESIKGPSQKSILSELQKKLKVILN
jgi:hypothetical protein